MDKLKKRAINRCILGVKRRDEESLYKLYDLIAHSIRYIALKYLKNEEDARDLEQDFWADIYEIVDKYTYIKNGFSYLCKVMTRMALNRYRKIHGENQHSIDVVDYKKVQSFDENALIDTIDIVVSVRNAMDTLEPLEMTVIQLIYFEDKTIKQIAHELKISKSKVGRIKLKAQEKLKQEIENYRLGKN